MTFSTIKIVWDKCQISVGKYDGMFYFDVEHSAEWGREAAESRGVVVVKRILHAASQFCSKHCGNSRNNNSCQPPSQPASSSSNALKAYLIMDNPNKISTLRSDKIFSLRAVIYNKMLSYIVLNILCETVLHVLALVAVHCQRACTQWKWYMKCTSELIT